MWWGGGRSRAGIWHQNGAASPGSAPHGIPTLSPPPPVSLGANRGSCPVSLSPPGTDSGGSGHREELPGSALAAPTQGRGRVALPAAPFLPAGEAENPARTGSRSCLHPLPAGLRPLCPLTRPPARGERRLVLGATKSTCHHNTCELLLLTLGELKKEKKQKEV